MAAGAMPVSETAPGGPDTFDLERFVRAQADTFDRALAELQSGRKQSHWMWYIFPQVEGLGRSAMAQQYAIRSLDEARSYVAHPVLGPRLLQCSEATLRVQGRSARDIFGSPDDLKLRSSATLFAMASAAGSVFHRLLDVYFGGMKDERTMELIRLKPDPR